MKSRLGKDQNASPPLAEPSSPGSISGSALSGMASPRASSTPTVSVDMHVIGNLRNLQGSGSDFLSTLIQLFLNSATEKMAVLDASLVDANLTQLRKAAHTLKSSCGNMGAFKMAALCQELEDMTSSGGQEFLKAADLVRRAHEEFVRVKEELAQVALEEESRHE